MFDDLSRETFETVLWLFPAAVALHVLEEAVRLPAWSREEGVDHPAGHSQFRLAAFVLALLALVAAGAACLGGKESLGAYLLAGYAAVMLLNAILHLVATTLHGAYTPGVVTAVALNVPVTLYLLGRAFGEGYVSVGPFCIAAGCALLAQTVVLPFLFTLGEYFLARTGVIYRLKHPPDATP